MSREFRILVNTLIRLYRLYQKGLISWQEYLAFRKKVLEDFLKRTTAN